MIQNLTKKILEFQNYKIYSAKNGKEVLDMMSKEDFDVLLLDINMPVMDGMECAKEIRKLSNKTKANVPIIAITGNAKNLNEYMQKPLNFDVLVEKVKALS